jgi:transcriptional regulator with PAS, ATPase and Fis domain
VRIITATNRNLKEMVERRQFREDLYYRLNVLAIEVPPLRERREDLPLLVEHFLARHAARGSRPPKRISPELMARFYEYHWPGNIRELENEIERLVVLSGDKELIGPELRMAGASPYVEDRALQRFREKGDMESAVAALEKEMIQHALVACSWNKTQVAKKLGVSRTTLIKKIQEYGLEDAPRAR